MANRFSVTRKRVAIAGCVFCAIAVGLLATGGAQAAMIMSQVQATGTVMGGSSALMWQISNSNNTALPMLCGQEIVGASAVESFLTSGGESKYQSAQAVQNGDLIQMQTERSLSFSGHGVYRESLLYEGAGEGSPEGGCGGDEFVTGAMVGETENQTPIPAVDPYCSMFMVDAGLMGSGLEYKSLGLVNSGSLESPDMVGMQFSGSGDGFGSLSARSMSITPWYSNHYSESMFTGGKAFSLEGKFQFTSFAKTFDEVPEAEAG